MKLLMALTLFVCNLAWGQSRTLLLGGRVPLVCSIQVNTGNPPLDILNGMTNFTVGSLSETCNRRTGFTVTISSANGGNLMNETGQTVPYTIQYDNSGVRSLAAPVVLTRNFAKLAVWTRSFRVNIAAQPNAVSGEYTDLVTVTIAAL